MLQYLSRAALVKASAYSRTLPVFKLDLYRRSAKTERLNITKTGRRGKKEK